MELTITDVTLGLLTHESGQAFTKERHVILVPPVSKRSVNLFRLVVVILSWHWFLPVCEPIRRYRKDACDHDLSQHHTVLRNRRPGAIQNGRSPWLDAGDDAVRPEVRIYINRLSDWFFVFARWVTKNLGKSETLWTPLAKRQNSTNVSTMIKKFHANEQDFESLE